LTEEYLFLFSEVSASPHSLSSNSLRRDGSSEILQGIDSLGQWDEVAIINRWAVGGFLAEFEMRWGGAAGPTDRGSTASPV
jgi:hypothetical protein